MKLGTKAFGMIGLICVAGSLVVLWGCGGGGKVAKRGDASATTASAGTGAGGPAQNEIAAVIETDTDTRKTAGGSFTDPRDNQTYRTVRIGNRTWMAENLNHQTESSWCYDDDPSNCDKYGRLYTWEAAKSACSGLGGGWRLPSDDDWDDLISVAGGDENAGKELKSKSGWVYDGNGTDEYGFSALPGGGRDSDGSFFGVGSSDSWWSATEDVVPGNAWNRSINSSYDNVLKDEDDKTNALSVRCLMD